jgi:hypothetical protein
MPYCGEKCLNCDSFDVYDEDDHEKCLNCDSFDVYDQDDHEKCLNCDLFDVYDQDNHVEDDDHENQKNQINHSSDTMKPSDTFKFFIYQAMKFKAWASKVYKLTYFKVVSFQVIYRL